MVRMPLPSASGSSSVKSLQSSPRVNNPTADIKPHQIDVVLVSSLTKKNINPRLSSPFLSLPFLFHFLAQENHSKSRNLTDPSLKINPWLK
ncbi:hypothetical protein HYC85_019542 [Camellia sinensis]|uniref:Uncharacterized protein n=1 Tax=Camellia sinensis TaxID=4442 RepID=A0A7J7GMG2_CAMSI|nr:hypothetical protein HYC85_019542 [Camellia sinensis]